MNPQYLTREEAAARIGLTASWLKKHPTQGPRQTVFGPRTIRYHIDDVDTFIEKQRGKKACSTGAGKSGGPNSNGTGSAIDSRRERKIAERLRSKRRGSRPKSRATLVLVPDAEPSRQ